jgi:hypothetical protein
MTGRAQPCPILQRSLTPTVKPMTGRAQGNDRTRLSNDRTRRFERPDAPIALTHALAKQRPDAPLATTGRDSVRVRFESSKLPQRSDASDHV